MGCFESIISIPRNEAMRIPLPKLMLRIALHLPQLEYSDGLDRLPAKVPVMPALGLAGLLRLRNFNRLLLIIKAFE